MSDRLHRRLGGHLRRHGIAYAAMTVALSFSPVPSMAADLVTTADIANGAVTQPKLAADSVNGGKVANDTITGVDIRQGTIAAVDLHASAKGAKVIRYDLGSYDFSTVPSTGFQLPGSWSAATVAGSSWTAILHHQNGTNYVVPGPGSDGETDYSWYVDDVGFVGFFATQGPGEVYNLRVYRTVATSTETVP